MKYVKVLGIYESADGLFTEIIEETHKSDLNEATDYIKEHPQENTLWILKPAYF